MSFSRALTSMDPVSPTAYTLVIVRQHLPIGSGRNEALRYVFSCLMYFRRRAKDAHKPPVFVEKLQNTGVAEGYPVRLECRVSGTPPPQIFWKKENESLTYSTDRVSMHQDNYGYICLLIQGSTKEDAGWYTVSAKNEAGIVSCTARLDVHTQWQHQPHITKPKKVRPSTSRYAALSDQGLDIKAAFQPDANPVHLQSGLVESDDL